MCEKRRFKLNINARPSWRRSGHVRNSINGSGSILPSSLGQVCPGKTFRPPQKISLTRARLPRFSQTSSFIARSAAVAAFVDPPPPPLPSSLLKENGQ